MSTAAEQVMDLIFGRWRSQILYAGAELGIFDRLDVAKPKSVNVLAGELNAHPGLLYRLLRAQAAIGLLQEDASQRFRLTDQGDLLTSEHPQSLRSLARLEEGPQHYALWRHLTAMIVDGQQNAFVREFGRMAFDHAREDSDYGERFGRAMSSYSAVQSALVLEALREYDFSAIETLCDVAGGHGHLACAFLQAYPHLSGMVLDLPEVVDDVEAHWARKLQLQDRCRYIAGDMFEEVPRADAYTLKMILHDWNDEECVEILSSIRRAAPSGARIFIIEHVIPSHDNPHFSKLFDVHMMCWGTGQERTEEQYQRLLEQSGWTPTGSYYPTNRLMGVITGCRSLSGV